MFISFLEFRNGNCSPVVELMPTVDPVGYTDRLSRRIAEVQPAQMIILPPISQFLSTIDSWIYVDTPRPWDPRGIGRQLAETSDFGALGGSTGR
jgi:hypothetical protein